MAKYKIEYNDNITKKTLTFSGHDFLNTWVPTEYGSTTLEEPFCDQVSEKIPDVTQQELELICDMEDTCIDDEVISCMSELTKFETKK